MNRSRMEKPGGGAYPYPHRSGIPLPGLRWVTIEEALEAEEGSPIAQALDAGTDSCLRCGSQTLAGGIRKLDAAA